MNNELNSLSYLSIKESPPGKVEVLQDLDLYYIKQLAHNFKEYDLEQKIALEIKMREGTTKLLTACGNRGPRNSQPHTLEAAKSLMTSNERMAAYMAELQRRRVVRRPTQEGPDPALARICVSDIRIPLVWKDIEHFKNKGDIRKFAVFVLLKIGTEIYDTNMVNPIDRSMTDICFDDIILLNGISPDFECTLEVFSYAFESDFSMTSLPRKLKKSLHSSISRTVGRKLAASLKDELSNEVGPKFEFVASTKLNVTNISNDVSTFDLHLENNGKENRQNSLPLFGHFCCRFAAQPDCFTQPKISSFINVEESEFSTIAYCRVIGWRMEVWESKEDAQMCPHHPLALSIDETTEMKPISKKTLRLWNRSGLDRGRLTCNFDDPAEMRRWARVLAQHAIDHGRWGRAAEEEMELLTPQPSRHSFAVPRQAKFTSLYEETSLADGSASEKSSFDDLSSTSSSTMLASFYTPIALPPRPRTFALSSGSSFRRFGSVRANMPFFRTKS